MNMSGEGYRCTETGVGRIELKRKHGPTVCCLQAIYHDRLANLLTVQSKMLTALEKPSTIITPVYIETLKLREY